MKAENAQSVYGIDSPPKKKVQKLGLREVKSSYIKTDIEQMDDSYSTLVIPETNDRFNQKRGQLKIKVMKGMKDRYNSLQSIKNDESTNSGYLTSQFKNRKLELSVEQKSKNLASLRRVLQEQQSKEFETSGSARLKISSINQKLRNKLMSSREQSIDKI